MSLQNEISNIGHFARFFVLIEKNAISTFSQFDRKNPSSQKFLKCEKLECESLKTLIPLCLLMMSSTT